MKGLDVFYVAAGGVIGVLLRWILSGVVKASNFSLGPFPISILVVNALGCFLASWWMHRGWLAQPTLSLALGVGFLGAFTTLSAVNLEVLEFLQAGQITTGFIYLFAHLALCAVFSLLGFLA